MQKSLPQLIFVDSSAFLALLDKNDENHKKAVSILHFVQYGWEVLSSANND